MGFLDEQREKSFLVKKFFLEETNRTNFSFLRFSKFSDKITGGKELSLAGRLIFNLQNPSCKTRSFQTFSPRKRNSSTRFPRSRRGGTPLVRGNTRAALLIGQHNRETSLA